MKTPDYVNVASVPGGQFVRVVFGGKMMMLDASEALRVGMYIAAAALKADPKLKGILPEVTDEALAG